MRANVYVCTNIETLADGRIGDSGFYQDYIEEATGDVLRWLEDKVGWGYAMSAPYHRDWHGGKFDRAGDKIGDDTYGYKCGFVCTLAKNPTKTLKKIIDTADRKLRRLLTKIGEQEDADKIRYAKEDAE